mgnify:CR=1 FL=1
MDSVTLSNSYVDFNEGGSALSAQLDSGAYSLTAFALELARVMTAAGGQTYSVVFSRSTRKLTISATGNFALLLSSGAHTGVSALILAGFSGGADRTGTNSYVGASTCGYEYKPQYFLQKYVPSANFQKEIMPSVNESASGKIEVLSFGTVNFIEMIIPFCTDVSQGAAGAIENNASGVANINSFLQAVTKKIDFEFMPDRDTESTFQKVLLESTPLDGKGVGYRLKEMFPLAGYFTTGKLTLRVVS